MSPAVGMSLALIIVTTLYFLCSITLTLMLPYTLISPDAAFSQVLRASSFRALRLLLPAAHSMLSNSLRFRTHAAGSQ
jgi:hypothetical protein